MLFLNLSASQDNNGNPRRLFLVLKDSGGVEAVIDEGYRGVSKVRKRFPDANEGPRINITVSEYNEWLRFGRTL
jgi:hypothetical protein